MEFHRYVTTYDDVMSNSQSAQNVKASSRRTGKDKTAVVYEQLQQQLQQQMPENYNEKRYNEFVYRWNTYQSEHDWIKAGRPYYNLWPGIIPYLSKVNLSKVPASEIKLPVKELVLRFPVDRNPVNIIFKTTEQYVLHSILLVIVKIRSAYESLITIIECVSKKENLTASITSTIHLYPDGSVEQAIASMDSVGDMTYESYTQIMRIVATTCLLSTDLEEQIVLPEVLKEDEEKWYKTHDPKYVDRARRRGRYGWNIGKTMQVSPHWRGPCPLAKYYYGPRPGVPRFRYRKGCMVHREQVDQIPTGSEENEEEQEQDQKNYL